MDFRFFSAKHCLEWYFSRKGSIESGVIDHGIESLIECKGIYDSEGFFTDVPIASFEDYVIAKVDIEGFLKKFSKREVAVLACIATKGRTDADKVYKRLFRPTRNSRRAVAGSVDSLLERFEDVLKKNDYFKINIG